MRSIGTNIDFQSNNVVFDKATVVIEEIFALNELKITITLLFIVTLFNSETRQNNNQLLV
jgi:hypothetical protein